MFFSRRDNQTYHISSPAFCGVPMFFVCFFKFFLCCLSSRKPVSQFVLCLWSPVLCRVPLCLSRISPLRLSLLLVHAVRPPLQHRPPWLGCPSGLWCSSVSHASSWKKRHEKPLPTSTTHHLLLISGSRLPPSGGVVHHIPNISHLLPLLLSAVLDFSLSSSCLKENVQLLFGVFFRWPIGHSFAQNRS